MTHGRSRWIHWTGSEKIPAPDRRLFGTMDALMDQMAKRDAQVETQIELMRGQLEQTRAETKALVNDLRARASSNQEGINTIMAEIRTRPGPRSAIAPRSVQTTDEQGRTRTSSSAGGYHPPPPSGSLPNPDDPAFLYDLLPYLPSRTHGEPRRHGLRGAGVANREG